MMVLKSSFFNLKMYNSAHLSDISSFSSTQKPAHVSTQKSTYFFLASFYAQVFQVTSLLRTSSVVSPTW